MTNTFTISPLNETAALVSFGNVIDLDVNKKVIGLHSELSKRSFEGFIESVPAYASLAIFYRNTTFDFVKEFLENLLDSQAQNVLHGSMIELPVLYDGEDLESLAQVHDLSVEQVIGLHTAKSYRVFMLGFLPGFAYMGSVDAQIAAPRKNSPRTMVPAGSVGIAGIQTGIYPQTSPGGWQLIGRTPLKIFDVKRESPCLLKPGDVVRFHSISKNEFDHLNEH